MSELETEVERRTSAAKAAILAAIDDESSVGLFVAHHLSEIEPEYWQQRIATSEPTPHQVVGLLELTSHWGDDDDPTPSISRCPAA